ncbi:MAG: SdpI family protein, partial [Candidatus Gracilibacteria bacterium]|nr:SdpI family protein [Candidatus Gracilibacteria bacterium]
TWEIFQFTLLGFFAYVYLVIIYVVLHPSAPMNVFMSLGTGALFIVLGNYLGKIRQNYFVGIKTPWTLANEDVWNKTHRIGGWAFIISGILFIINSFILEKYVWITFMFIITFCLFVPIIYSYVIFKKITKKGE